MLPDIATCDTIKQWLFIVVWWLITLPVQIIILSSNFTYGYITLFSKIKQFSPIWNPSLTIVVECTYLINEYPLSLASLKNLSVFLLISVYPKAINIWNVSGGYVLLIISNESIGKS